MTPWSQRLTQSWRIARFSGATAAMLWLVGCESSLVPAQLEVLVDAISAPEAVSPVSSYRIVALRSNTVTSQTPAVVVKACVDAAMTGRGLYEAPATAAPDLFIEVSYGQESSPHLLPGERQTFVEISARANPGHVVVQPMGPEIWNVRAAILGVRSRVETAMPLLVSVAASYAGANTGVETPVAVPANSPAVKALRETAAALLNSRTTVVQATAAAATQVKD